MFVSEKKNGPETARAESQRAANKKSLAEWVRAGKMQQSAGSGTGRRVADRCTEAWQPAFRPTAQDSGCQNYADGCFRISARARRRVASAGSFAAAALWSKAGAICFNFATLPLFMCEASAVSIPFLRAAIWSGGSASERDNWSR